MAEKKYKIILVDDDDFLLNMYATKFGLSGDTEIEAFKSGVDLIENLKNGTTADLILLDIVMPSINGIEVLRQMRKQNIGHDIPVVMLTNQNDEKDIAETKKLGVSGYIVKSAATPSEVVEEVMKIIKSKK